MDGLKIYHDYFRKKYELINDFLDQLIINYNFEVNNEKDN